MPVTKRTNLNIGYWALVLCLEALATFIVYHAIGAVTSGAVVLASLLANAVVLVVCCLRFRLGILLGFSFLALVYFCTAPLGVRLYYVDREAKRIVSWAHSQKIKTGSYPEDLSGYIFLSPGCKEYIDYHKGVYEGKDEFEVYYIVGTRNTGHRYDTEDGWFYYSD
jgi:hypothetical protein